MPKKRLSCSIPKLIDQIALKHPSLAVHSLPNDTFLSVRSKCTVQTATRLILEHLFQSSPLSFDLCQQRQRDRLARSELLTLKNTDRRLRRSARSAMGHATGGRISISTQHLHWLCRLCHTVHADRNAPSPSLLHRWGHSFSDESNGRDELSSISRPTADSVRLGEKHRPSICCSLD